MPNPTTTGPAGVALIKTFESCRLEAYNDNPADPDKGKWTIGWGQTGEWIGPGLTVTQEEADRLLDRALLTREAELSGYLKPVAVFQWEFDALMSFAYNVGMSNLAGSTLMNRLLQTRPNTRDRRLVASEFMRWTYQGKAMLDGLLRRRMAEADLFINGGDKVWWRGAQTP